MRTGTLNATKKTTNTSKPGGKIEATGSARVRTAVKKDADAHGEGHENGNGEGLLIAEEGSYIDPSDTEDHDHESECEHENFGNGSLEASYAEESSGVVDEAGAHDHEGTSSFSVDQAMLRSQHHSSRLVLPNQANLLRTFTLGMTLLPSPHTKAAEVLPRTRNETTLLI